MSAERIVYLSVRAHPDLVKYHTHPECSLWRTGYPRIRSFEADMLPAKIEMCVHCGRREDAE